MSITPVKSNEEKESVETQENKENMETEETFLDNIQVDGAADDADDAEEKKNTNNVEKKVVILNIDKTKTNDEVEDYLYDNYPNLEIEQFRVIRMIPYRVIITLDSRESVEKFVSEPFVKGELIGFKDKINKMSLEDFRSQSADRKKQKLASINGLVIKCSGFKESDSKEQILQYMKDNHENVSDVEKKGATVFVTFEKKESADRFLGLSYVKCGGEYVTREKNIVKTRTQIQTGKKQEPGNNRRVETTGNRKRKTVERDSVSNTKPAPTAPTNTTSACLTLRGFKNPQTNYVTIKDALDRKGIKPFDIQFVKYDINTRVAIVTMR